LVRPETIAEDRTPILYPAVGSASPTRVVPPPELVSTPEVAVSTTWVASATGMVSATGA
jgi:hypothetical protein